ncbi:hypothetical protein JF535_02335 [Microbulbifer salipaludis]|uniref:Uncharacterized protein n=1 Tax=Microbulbifer salipaludis TaxID=187980 RepID=A0ABS3E300_9GAMM|nr:hypothetical protein [Microbulbifer salipaludis]MBN8429682.1 hypothetical protein [Microbulbifer salipaludis]
MIKLSAIISAFVFLISCAVANEPKGQQELYDFAQANCLFWYFDSKGYDTEDIRAISGGMVEVSDVPIEKFEEISLFIKSYSPEVASKNNVDERLVRCFQLRDSEALRALIVGR